MLNDRQKAFAEHYAACGNGAEACRRAGYSQKTARTQASELLTNPDILDYVAQLREETASARIASIAQIRAFWSDIFHDEAQRISDRLRASELLAKSAGAFIHTRPDDGGAGYVAGEDWADDSVLIVLPDNGRDPDVSKNYVSPEAVRLLENDAG